jgi:hypothetical protein
MYRLMGRGLENGMRGKGLLTRRGESMERGRLMKVRGWRWYGRLSIFLVPHYLGRVRGTPVTA